MPRPAKAYISAHFAQKEYGDQPDAEIRLCSPPRTHCATPALASAVSWRRFWIADHRTWRTFWQCPRRRIKRFVKGTGLFMSGWRCTFVSCGKESGYPAIRALASQVCENRGHERQAIADEVPCRSKCGYESTQLRPYCDQV